MRRVLIWTGAGVAALGVAAGGYQVDRFLASDPHFILPGAPDDRANPNFVVEGMAYAPRAEVMAVFARDFGRSVYLVPLAERRRRLVAIDWVRDAVVQRHWPNRIAVRIVERKPVAFAMLPGVAAGRAISEVALIDAEGVILRLPPRAQFSLPALFGVSRQDAPPVRRARAGQAVELIREAQAYAGQISEIDVSDPENLTITQIAQGRPLRLRLGTGNYSSKLNNFLSHYPDISRRLPNARTFDLRLDDHITAQDGGGGDGR
jgi:cell division protein FtsQ